MNLTWNGLFGRTDTVGGYLETNCTNGRYVGPIVNITRTGEKIDIACQWTARYDKDRDNWVLVKGGANGMCGVIKNLRLEDGKIKFESAYPNGASFMIHLRGGWAIPRSSIQNSRSGR